MRKTSFLIGFRFIISSLIVLSIFVFTSFFAYADTGAFYRCVDKEGNEILTDHNMGGHTCKKIDEFEKMSDEESEKYRKDREKKSIEIYEEIKVADKKAAEEAAKKAAEKARIAAEEAKEKRLRDLEKRTEAAEQAAAAAANQAWQAQQEARRAQQEAEAAKQSKQRSPYRYRWP